MRKKLAFAMALAMALTSVPANGLVSYAEEETERVESVSDEIISEEPAEDPAETEGEANAEEKEVQGEDTLSLESIEVLEDGTVAEEAANTGNRVEVNESNTNITVEPNTEVTMDAGAKAEEGVKLSYQWYQQDYDEGFFTEIPDAESSTYTASIGERNTGYYCEITDEEGNSRMHYFYIYTNTLKLEGRINPTDLKPGEIKELKPNVHTVLTNGELTYKWKKYNSEEQKWVTLATTPSYTIKATPELETGSYVCEISDGNRRDSAEFPVGIETGFELADVETDFDVKPYETVVLDSTATAYDGVEMTYEWQKLDQQSDKYVPIDGANGARYTVKAGTGLEWYKCIVKNNYGESETQYFYVDVYSIEIDMERTETEHFVRPGEDTTLQVYASSLLTGNQLQYQWYTYNKRAGGWTALTGKNTDALKVDNNTAGSSYKCEISDGYNSDEVRFYIRMNTGFSAEAEQYAFKMKAGESVTLRVLAKSDYPLTYQWYRTVYSEDEENEVAIPGANGESYTVSGFPDSESGGCGYQCHVSDPYNSEIVDFYISVDTGFSAAADEAIWVPAGTTAEIKIRANTFEAYGPLKYEWSVLNETGKWHYLDDVTTPDYKVENVQKVETYRCEVSNRLVSEELYIMVGPLSDRDAYALDFESAKEFKAGEENTVTVAKPRTGMYFKFVPEQTGNWKLYSVSNSDTSAYLYDSNKNELAENDDDPHRTSGSNFGITYRLEQGKTYYLKCGYYDSSEVGSYTVLAKLLEDGQTEHTWDKGRTTRKPTCESAGEKTYTCTGCGETRTEQLPALGHAYPSTWTVRKAATCLTDGVEYRVCSRCKKEETRTIQARGAHSFGAYVVTKQPTVLEAGSQVRTCTVCGATERAEIAKLKGVIRLTTKQLPLQVKKSVQLSRIVKDLAAGDAIVSCTSSKPKVATVDNKGKVTGKAAGKTVVTIRLASGVSDQVTISVQKKAVAASSITNVSKSLKLKIGGKYTLSPVISPITTADKASYSSSDKKIVTVTKQGVITAKKAGTAKITVKAGKKKVTVKVTVEKMAPTGMKGVSANKTLKKGKSFTIKPKLTPSGAEAKITYTSSNKKVATVNAKGKVTAKKAGTATITVKAGNVIRTCVVTVK